VHFERAWRFVRVVDGGDVSEGGFDLRGVPDGLEDPGEFYNGRVGDHAPCRRVDFDVELGDEDLAVAELGRELSSIGSGNVADGECVELGVVPCTAKFGDWAGDGLIGHRGALRGWVRGWRARINRCAKTSAHDPN